MSPSGEDLKHPVFTRCVGRLSGQGTPLPVSGHFVLAGIDWHQPERAQIELRAHLVAGGWTPWLRASGLGHDGSGGEAGAHAHVGDPVWTGLADAVQLRSASPVEGVNLHLV